MECWWPAKTKDGKATFAGFTQDATKHLKRLRVNLLVEDIERTHKIGQHEEVQARIAAFYQEGFAKEAGEKQKIIVQDLKTKYETAKQRMQQAPRQHKAARTLGKYPKVIQAALLSPVVDLRAVARPSRLL